MGCWWCLWGGNVGSHPSAVPTGSCWALLYPTHAELGQAETFPRLYVLTTHSCEGKLISWVFPFGIARKRRHQTRRPGGLPRHPGGIRYGWHSIPQLRLPCFIDFPYLCTMGPIMSTMCKPQSRADVSHPKKPHSSLRHREASPLDLQGTEVHISGGLCTFGSRREFPPCPVCSRSQQE